MKKILTAVALIVCLASSLLLTCCGNADTISIYVPDGAPALAVANIIDGGRVADINAVVTATTGEDVKTKCISGQADIAVLPTNAAVKICSDNGDYSLFTVNVWGLLYVIGWENISDLSELQGKSLRSIGAGDTGEYLFKRILDANGVSYDGGVNIQYAADGTEAVNLLLLNKCDFALLGEPAATNAVNKAKVNGKTLYRVFDLQQLWQETAESASAGYPQASVIVKKSLLQKDGFADALYDTFTENAVFLPNNASRLDGVLASAGSLLTVKYTADVLERCNINAVKACEVKDVIFEYLSQFNGSFANLLKDEMYYEFNG